MAVFISHYLTWEWGEIYQTTPESQTLASQDTNTHRPVTCCPLHASKATGAANSACDLSSFFNQVGHFSISVGSPIWCFPSINFTKLRLAAAGHLGNPPVPAVRKFLLRSVLSPHLVQVLPGLGEVPMGVTSVKSKADVLNGGCRCQDIHLSTCLPL